MHAWPELSDVLLATVIAATPASAVHDATTTIEAPEIPAESAAPLRGERLHVGGYGGVGVRVGPIGGLVGVFTVSRGGVLLGERLSLGGAVVSVAPRHGFGTPMRGMTGRLYTMAMLYVGIEVGWVAFRRGRVEAGAQSLLGVGVACVTRLRGRRDHACVERSAVVVAEPSAFVRVDLTPAKPKSSGRRAMIRVEFTGGYRFGPHRRWPSGNEVRLEAPYVGANLDFGWFPRAPVRPLG